MQLFLKYSLQTKMKRDEQFLQEKRDELIREHSEMVC
jgi:hypothetical protein